MTTTVSPTNAPNWARYGDTLPLTASSVTIRFLRRQMGFNSALMSERIAKVSGMRACAKVKAAVSN